MAQASYSLLLLTTSMTNDKQKTKEKITDEELMKSTLEFKDLYKALAEYELNKSTGEVQRVSHD